MIVLAGCRIEVDTKTSAMPTGSIVMPSGKILISDFDVTTVRNFLIATEEVKDYHIILNTSGGSSNNCTTMINRIQLLQKQGAHITTEIIGYGMSAGAFVFLTGDVRIAHTGAILMFHGAGVQQGYERIDASKACKSDDAVLCSYLNMLDATVIDLLMDKTAISEDDIAHWMYFEEYNFMDAEEALELNVATVLIGD